MRPISSNIVTTIIDEQVWDVGCEFWVGYRFWGCYLGLGLGLGLQGL